MFPSNSSAPVLFVFLPQYFFRSPLFHLLTVFAPIVARLAGAFASVASKCASNGVRVLPPRCIGPAIPLCARQHSHQQCLRLLLCCAGWQHESLQSQSIYVPLSIYCFFFYFFFFFLSLLLLAASVAVALMLPRLLSRCCSCCCCWWWCSLDRFQVGVGSDRCIKRFPLFQQRSVRFSTFRSQPRQVIQRLHGKFCFVKLAAQFTSQYVENPCISIGKPLPFASFLPRK